MREQNKTIINMLNQNLKIRIHNEGHNKVVQKRLFELGYSWVDGDKNITNTDATYIYTNSYTLIFKCGYDTSFFKVIPNKEVNLDDLYKISKEKSIQLTSDYKAIVRDGFVEVGCQKILFEKVEELYNLIKSE